MITPTLACVTEYNELPINKTNELCVRFTINSAEITNASCIIDFYNNQSILLNTQNMEDKGRGIYNGTTNKTWMAGDYYYIITCSYTNTTGTVAEGFILVNSTTNKLSTSIFGEVSTMWVIAFMVLIIGMVFFMFNIGKLVNESRFSNKLLDEAKHAFILVPFVFLILGIAVIIQVVKDAGTSTQTLSLLNTLWWVGIFVSISVFVLFLVQFIAQKFKEAERL